MLYGNKSEKIDFDNVKISIASPTNILDWSCGEVVKPDTVNYRTIKPEHGGLFCARIFGPVRDYECLCGKYKRIKYKEIVCEKCGVEVTTSKVRRQRMGHIKLATPVVHIWFLRSLPSKISTLLDLPIQKLEAVLYFENYVVVEPGITDLQYGQLLSEKQYEEHVDKYGEDSFDVSIGAEAIRDMLKSIDLPELQKSLRKEVAETNSEAKRKRFVKRLKLVEEFLESGNSVEWMVIDMLPILPPDLRPLVMLEGGRFATSDLNELYRRVINRNNRLKRLIELKAPEMIVRNEQRMLQESVDALFDNSRRGKVVKGSNKRALKSLTDMLKGKQGRFRQNLLGKRVDYSGRSVIVAGPELRLHQCGLPKKMALELFKPFIYSKLLMYGLAATLKSAKRMVEQVVPEVWDVLAEVVKGHMVLLNRAPTLHRLGIRAFEPILIEGKAIQLHPLVCSAYNADFDGDQMAVHIPLSIEAQLEARVLMMSSNNILSPGNGKPVILPTKDIVLGIYYLTLEDKNLKKSKIIFSGPEEVQHALENNIVELHTPIKCRMYNVNDLGEREAYLAETTPGRVILAQLISEDMKISFKHINKLMDKKELSSLVELVYRKAGGKKVVIFCDRLLELGFRYASKSGISMGKNDILVPGSRDQHLNSTLQEVKKYENQYADGLITTGEKYNKVVDAWSRCTESIVGDMMDVISSDVKEPGGKNNIFMMADSGARGSVAQIRQLAGMRGLMAKSSGEIIATPILSNFKEGLTELEYFISTNGARKGMTDIALKTASSGYLTRKLVDVSQDCTVVLEDCGTKNSITVQAVIEDGEVIVELSNIIFGRVASLDISHPTTGEKLAREGQIITEEVVSKIEAAGIDSVSLRSPVVCEIRGGGICAKCYGMDLATGEKVDLGEAVGVIAAQAIGEPGTQLTMRTFHIGGAATKGAAHSSIIASYSGVLKFTNSNFIVDSAGNKISMSRGCRVRVVGPKGEEKAEYKIPYGATLLAYEGKKVESKEKLVEWDPFNIPIITEKSGKVVFIDLVPGISVREVVDDVTGMTSSVVTNWKQQSKGADLRPRIVLHDDEGKIIKLANGLEARYFLPVSAVLSVENGAKVHMGDVIARIPKESSKTKDITGGLPRVVELFEARKPKDHSIIAEIDGYVSFGRDYKSKRRIVLQSKDGKQKVEYLVSRGKHITVDEGDYVLKGDMLMEGNPSLQDILKVMGVEALTKYMVNEVQSVYRLQGVEINDKHIEVVLHQMLQKVEITDPGETTLLQEAYVDKEELQVENEKALKNSYIPAVGIPVLQGITKASLNTRSFFSAASFQETTRVLTDSAIAGKVDPLNGLKENVIVGRLIPAGTGYYLSKFKEKARVRDMEYLAQQKTKEQEETPDTK